MTMMQKASMKLRNQLAAKRAKQTKKANEAGKTIAEQWQDLLRSILIRSYRPLHPPPPSSPPPPIFSSFTYNVLV